MRFMLFLFLFIPIEQVEAQYPFSKITEIDEENLALKSTVLIRDHQGFLWIGTSSGIFKYNSAIPENITAGLKVKPYITALFEDGTGTIWAGCKNGQVLKVRNKQVSVFNPGEGFPKVDITSIVEDSKKRLWFATAGEGIYCYDNIHVYRLTTKDGLSDDYVNCLYTTDGHQIIAGTDGGLSFITFDQGKKNIKIVTSKNGLPDNIIRCITKSNTANTVWVGMQSKGVILFAIDDNQVMDVITNNNGWLYNQVNDVIEVTNSVFIATEENGIICYDKKNREINEKVLPDSLYPERIADLQQDNEGNIWATAANKLISFTGNYLQYWHTAKGINFIKVHSLHADDENKLWFTPDLRLFESTQTDFGKDYLRSYDITPPQNHIDITGLYKDRFGFLWIGTMGEGLFRMHVETGKWRRIAENPIAYFGNILSISGKDDQVWISTLNGVSRFDLTVANYELNAKIQFNNYSKKDGLGSDYIYHILIDKKNRVWFATDGAGVTVFENSAFTNFYTSGQFPASVAYSLAEDNNQHIWINTYNEGLFEYTGKHFIQYGIKNGLTDLGITAIAVDAFNNIITINKKRDRCAESSKKYCAALWR